MYEKRIRVAYKIPPPKFEPGQAVGRRRRNHKSERGRNDSHQKAVQEIGQKRGVLKEVPIVIENERVGKIRDEWRMISLSGFRELRKVQIKGARTKRAIKKSDDVGSNGPE